MDTIEEIKKLKALLDQGAINEEEFNSLKKKVLSEINDLKEDKETISSTSTTETIPAQKKKKKPSPDVKKPTSKGKKVEEVQTGAEWTEILAYFVLAAAILLSLVFWIRYNSFWIFLIALAISILIPWRIGKVTPKAIHKNLYFVALIAMYIILISYPIGIKKSASSSSSTSESSSTDGGTRTSVLHCIWCKKTVTKQGAIICYTSEPDGCGLVQFYGGTKYAFCSDECCDAFQKRYPQKTNAIGY